MRARAHFITVFPSHIAPDLIRLSPRLAPKLFVRIIITFLAFLLRLQAYSPASPSGLRSQPLAPVVLDDFKTVDDLLVTLQTVAAQAARTLNQQSRLVYDAAATTVVTQRLGAHPIGRMLTYYLYRPVAHRPHAPNSLSRAIKCVGATLRWLFVLITLFSGMIVTLLMNLCFPFL